MTKNNEQMIECKYKFQSIEKFAGKPYCTLHNETCEFINFVCDKNCQVYEDYKQLKRKEQECEELKQTLEEIREISNKTLCDYLQCSLNYNHSKDFECEKTSCNRAKRREFILKILQKINEVEE